MRIILYPDCTCALYSLSDSYLYFLSMLMAYGRYFVYIIYRLDVTRHVVCWYFMPPAYLRLLDEALLPDNAP